MTALNVIVTHDGTAYDALVGTIASTNLGTDGPAGFMTASLEVKFSSGGTGVGNAWVLDEYDAGVGRRIGTELGANWILEIMSTVGVERWERLVGQRVLVLYEANGGTSFLGREAVGIANVDTGAAMIFQQFMDVWLFRARHPASKGK